MKEPPLSVLFDGFDPFIRPYMVGELMGWDVLRLVRIIGFQKAEDFSVRKSYLPHF